VGYRSSHPDEQTVKDAMKELQDNNIDASQLVEFSTDHCKEVESLIEEDVLHRALV
jgi:hypothetical protein